MKNRFGKVVRYFLLSASIFGIAIVLFGLSIMLRPRDSLGEADGNCARQDFPSIPNGNGMIATSHLVDCTYFIAHGEETTFVYVHRSDEKDSRGSLVFRFANAGNLDIPFLTWSDSSDLRISVSQVGEVTKQVPAIEGVKILYSIGKEDAPAGETDRIRKRIAGVLFLLLLLLTATCVLSVRSIRKHKTV
jgi:hypothetical protein